MRLCKSHVAIEEQSCKMYLDLDNSGISCTKALCNAMFQYYPLACSAIFQLTLLLPPGLNSFGG